MAKFYLKYNITYQQVFDKLNHGDKINFFIDLQSVCTGFYDKNVVLMEIGRYASEGKMSDVLLTEYQEYLLNLYRMFKNYDPYFVTFYDDGRCQQNRALQKQYKSKSSMDNIQLEVENIQLFRTIKKYYYEEINKKYNKPDISKTFYLKEYEADLIPYYCIKNNLFDSNESKTKNFILSKDKDLLQCLQFSNTFQIVSGYKPSTKEKVYTRIFDNDSAIEYIYPKFRRGILSAKHIPLILAIAGDSSDEIIGVKGIGPAKAISLIQDYRLPIDVDSLKRQKDLPPVLYENLDLIVSNLKLTDFDEQLKRIPSHIF